MPFDPAAQELPLRLEGPTGNHWFGLDELGRDILSRVLLGARVSLLVGLVVVGVSATVGTAMGAIAGYYGGRVDQVISRVMDILLAFPGLLLAIALVAVLGPSLGNVVLALTVIGWVGYARLVRGQVLRAREFEYVVAAQGAGRGHVAGADAARAADRAAGRDGAGDAGHGRRDPLGSGAQLSWPRRAAADAELGHDDQRRARASARRAAPDGLPGHLPRARGARVQFPG